MGELLMNAQNKMNSRKLKKNWEIKKLDKVKGPKLKAPEKVFHHSKFGKWLKSIIFLMWAHGIDCGHENMPLNHPLIKSDSIIHPIIELFDVK